MFATSDLIENIKDGVSAKIAGLPRVVLPVLRPSLLLLKCGGSRSISKRACKLHMGIKMEIKNVCIHT